MVILINRYAAKPKTLVSSKLLRTLKRLTGSLAEEIQTMTGRAFIMVSTWLMVESQALVEKVISSVELEFSELMLTI
jgi:hypothetical protein